MVSDGRRQPLPALACLAPTLQVGNLTYGFDPTLPADARLVSAQLSVPGAGGASSWVPLEGYEGEIVLLTNDYVAKGGD